MGPAKHKIFTLWPFTQKVCQPALVYSIIQIKIKTVCDLM